MKKKIIIIILIVLVLGLILYFVARKPEPTQVPPVEEELRPLVLPDLTEIEKILLTGEIVVKAIGTFDSQDSYFRNLRSIQGYVTEDLENKIQAMIRQGIDEQAVPFEQTTAVLSKSISNQEDLLVEALYTVEVSVSSREETRRETHRVDLVKIGGKWYVDNTTQLE